MLKTWLNYEVSERELSEMTTGYQGIFLSCGSCPSGEEKVVSVQHHHLSLISKSQARQCSQGSSTFTEDAKMRGLCLFLFLLIMLPLSLLLSLSFFLFLFFCSSLSKTVVYKASYSNNTILKRHLRRNKFKCQKVTSDSLNKVDINTRGGGKSRYTRSRLSCLNMGFL